MIGSCIATNVCVCQTGYYGSVCEMHNCFGIVSNSTSVCNGNGVCIAPDTCACSSGNYGTECEVALNQLRAQILDQILQTMNLCPAGTYKISNDSTKASVCTNCPAGTYNSFSGATSISSCTGCPAGTFSTALGASSISTCQTCPPGEFYDYYFNSLNRNIWKRW
jgi:hypothetical protein